MKSTLGLLLTLAPLACAHAPTGSIPPRSDEAPLAVLVWVGHGEAERLEDGVWKRVPDFDYDFSVEQRRYADRWSSVKSMRRRSPSYDESAGPRVQTYFFELGFTRDGDAVRATIDSTLGPGRGTTDPAFRAAVLELTADVSSLAPFDTYRITQQYGYEAGTLTEVVELFDHDGGREVPWVRNRETATLFAERRFDAPPTSLATR
jgi:hypothetical protein